MSFETANYTPDNLAELLSEAQDNNLMAALGAGGYEATGLTHDEMLNYAPASMQTMYPNPAPNPPGMAGFGVSDSWTNFNWLIFAGVGLGLYYLMHNKQYNF